MSSSVERSGSFEHVKHRESVDSVVEDASPTAVAKKHPWKKDKSSSRTPPKRDERAERKLPDERVNGSSGPAVTIAKGTWKPLHERNADERAQLNETVIEAQQGDTSDKEEKTTPISSPEQRSEETTESDRKKSPERIKSSESDVPVDVTVESADSRDHESSTLSGAETKSSPESMSQQPSSPIHVLRSRNMHDETLAHLVQMVESNDFTENGGQVPFADQESKASLSDYSVVDDTPMAYFQSATMSSGYSAEDDLDGSTGMFFQSATLSSGGFSALEFNDKRGALLPSGGEADEKADLTAGDATEVASRNFAMEHRIFMKAALELLTQRERYAADVDMNDKDTIKSGPLKKASHLVRGIWKVKYAEVRRGVFSYYEDESKDSEVGTLVRKNIPLHAATCTCRAVKIQHNALSVNPDGAIFELNIERGPKRLWMANTREERSAWIQAINAATLGRSVTRGESDIDHHAGKSGTVSDESPYRVDLELYVNIQREITRASSREYYLGSLSELVGKKLNVPIQWIRQQMGGIEHANRAFHEEAVSRGVSQLWKDLLRDSVRIEDELFVGGSGHAPESIIAALMRCILDSDRSSPLSVHASKAQKNKYYISESQSLSYARDILLAGNRTRSGGDSYYCVNTLCKNPEQVVTVPSSLEAEPWQINISHVQPEKRGRGDTYYSLNELSGWLKTRSKPQKKWKKRYFVLSEGTLSYFEKALPRPRGLRGQVGVTESAISVNRVPKSDSKRSKNSSHDADNDSPEHFLVSIVSKDGKLDRQILFEDEKKFILWTHSLEAYCVDDELWQSNHSVSMVRSMFRNLREELIGTQELYGNFVLGHKSLKNNADELGLDSEEVNTCISNASKSGANGRATVMVTVEASTDYKICTLDPQGDEKEDTWATIRAVFLQNFRLSGGPNGRIIRGEEIVQINVTNCHKTDAAQLFAEHVSPLSRFRGEKLKRPLRMRRSMSS